MDVAKRGGLCCRSCGAGSLERVLSLGRVPLANALLTRDDLGRREPLHPLDLAFCRACSLVQILEGLPPQQLFAHYLYLSSLSDTMLMSARDISARLIRERRLGPHSLVIELASNDGYLLQYYKERNVRVLGIEPAVNVAEVAIRERGIPSIARFFGRPLAEGLRADGQVADVVHANNVLAHVPDPNDFVAGMGVILKDGGIASIEVPYVRELIDGLEFDTIYHEHFSYFSMTALNSLFSRHRLRIIDVERLPIHGGSLRVFVAHSGVPSPAVERLLTEERREGVCEFAYYARFADDVQQVKGQLVKMLRDRKQGGARIAAYGASAKGTTLLNYCHIGAELIDFVVDRSTIKQGLFTPGAHLPIHAPEALLDRRPDLVLLLTWNFADEILRQQQAYRDAGGLFVIPVPVPRLL